MSRRERREGYLKGKMPESWLCVDCGINTAPGLLSRIEMERACKTAAVIEALSGKDPGVKQEITAQCEIYTVRNAVWKAAGMEPWGGCLCIGCLEERFGRQLRPKDFLRRHPFNGLPGTPRLLQRRAG